MAKATSPMGFKVKPDERRKIVADARAAGLTVGSYIRSRLLDVVITAVTYKRTQTRRLIMHLIAAIGRIGNNMNQIAWKLNRNEIPTGLDRQLHAEGIQALKDIRLMVIQQLLNEG